MRCLVSPSPALSSASTTLRPPSKLPTTTWRVSRPAPSFLRLKLRRRPDETVALRPRCLVVRAQMNHDHEVQPNHFVEDFQTIMERFEKLCNRKRYNKKNVKVTDDFQPFIDQVLYVLPHVCRFTAKAAIMASQLVDSGRLTGTGLSTKICADTVRSTLRPYVDIFLHISNDCSNTTFYRGTMIRFVGALRGLGSISHILLEDALEALNHTDPTEGLLEYTFNGDVKRIHRDFNCKMDKVNDRICDIEVDYPVKLAFVKVFEGLEATESFLGLMLARRQRTLEKACGGSK